MSEVENVVHLKRLYLDKNINKNSVESYKNHLNRLSVLELKTLKLLFAIYSDIQNKIEELMSEDILKFHRDKLSLNNEILGEEKKYKSSRYYNDRMVEDDVSRFLNLTWIENLKSVTIELEYYYEKEIIDIFVKCNVMKDLIETYITIKDEYWLPSSFKIIDNIELLGYDISEKKERIWQPKS